MHYAEIDVGPNRLQRHSTIHLGDRAAHFGAAKSTRKANLDALRAAPHRGLNRVLHRPPVRNAPRYLLGNALRDQASIGLRHLDLFDLQMNLFAHLVFEHLAQALNVRALLTDNDARLRRVQRNVNFVGVPLELDPRNPGPRQLFHDELANLDILVELLGVIPLGVPLGLPVADDAQTVADWIDLASHLAASPILGN